MTSDEKAFAEWWNKNGARLAATKDLVRDVAAAAFEAGSIEGLKRGFEAGAAE